MIIWQHFSFRTQNINLDEMDAFEQTIQGYNVIALFNHHSDSAHRVWRGYDEYGMSAPFKADRSGFAAVRLTDTEMLVANFIWTADGYTWDGGGSWEWHHVKAIDPPLAKMNTAVVNGTMDDVSLEPAPFYPNSNLFPVGTEVTLTGESSAPAPFIHWEIYDPNHPGDANYAAVDANNPITVIMDTDREVVAVFKCAEGVSLPLAFLAMGGLATVALPRRRRSPNTPSTSSTESTASTRHPPAIGSSAIRRASTGPQTSSTVDGSSNGTER